MDKLKSFIPSPALLDFMKSTQKRLFVRAANRVGKTWHAAAKLAHLMLLKPHGRYRAVGVTNKQAVSVISRYLALLLPPGSLADGCTYSEERGWVNKLIRLRNGSTCQIMSSEQPALAHAGDDLDGVWIDEPPPRDIYTESLTRVVSRNGFVWLTMTPIGRPVEWLKDTIESGDWAQWLIEYKPENVPWQKEEEVLAWIEECRADASTFKQKIHGDWEGQPVDVIFNGFTGGFVGDFTVSNPRYFVGIDHGEKTGRQVAVLICQDNKIFVMTEYVSKKATSIEEDAQAIVNMCEAAGISPIDVSGWYGDTNSAGKAGNGYSVNELLSAAIISIVQKKYPRFNNLIINQPWKGHGSVQTGERLINSAFIKETLLVSEDCSNLIYSLKHYSGEEDLKHIIDALRYVTYPLLNNTKPISNIQIRN